LLELIRYWGSPNAVCGENNKMPVEYQALYKGLLQAKVTFPPGTTYLDWPRGVNQSALLASAAVDPDAGVTGDNPLRLPASNIAQNRSSSPQQPAATQVAGGARNSAGQNNYSDFEPKLKALKEARTKAATLIYQNPTAPALRNLIKDYQKATKAVTDHPKYQVLQTDQSQQVENLKGRTEAEVAMANYCFEQYQILEMERDVDIFQIGIDEGFRTYLNLDPSSNPEHIGADPIVIDTREQERLEREAAAAEAEAERKRKEEEERKKKEEAERKKREEDERKAREAEEKRKRDQEEAEKKRKEEEERKKKQKEEEERRKKEELEKERIRKEKEELERKERERIEQEEKLKREKELMISSPQVQPAKLSHIAEVPQYVPEPKLIGSPMGSSRMGVQDRGIGKMALTTHANVSGSAFDPKNRELEEAQRRKRDQELEAINREVMEETYKLTMAQKMKEEESRRAKEPILAMVSQPSFANQQSAVKSTPPPPLPPIESAPKNLTELIGQFQAPLLDKAISIEEERQRQKKRWAEEKERTYLQEIDDLFKSNQEKSKADREYIKKNLEILEAMREQRRSKSVYDMAAILPNKDTQFVQSTLDKISTEEGDMITNQLRLVKLAESLSRVNKEIGEVDLQRIQREHDAAKIEEQMVEIRAQVMEMQREKDELHFKNTQIRKQINNGQYGQSDSNKIEKLQQTIDAMNKINSLKRKEIENNLKLKNQLESEYREYLAKPANFNRRDQSAVVNAGLQATVPRSQTEVPQPFSIQPNFAPSDAYAFNANQPQTKAQEPFTNKYDTIGLTQYNLQPNNAGILPGLTNLFSPNQQQKDQSLSLDRADISEVKPFEFRGSAGSNTNLYGRDRRVGATATVSSNDPWKMQEPFGYQTISTNQPAFTPYMAQQEQPRNTKYDNVTGFAKDLEELLHNNSISYAK